MFDVPELDDMIYLQLRPGDLVQCAQVNKKWHRASIPYIWRDLAWSLSTVRLDAFYKMAAEDYLHELWQQNSHGIEQSTTQPTQPTSSPFSSALAKYGHWIRKTPAPRQLFRGFVFPVCLYDKWTGLPSEAKRDPSPDEMLRHFYKYCHNPIQVDYMDLQDMGLETDHWNTIADNVVIHVRHLKVTLYLPDKVDSWKLTCTLDRLSATLETLTLEVDNCSLKDGEGAIEERSWTSLKELKILKPCNILGKTTFWSWLWTRCSHVNTLDITLVDTRSIQDLVEAIRTYMPNLDTIRLRMYMGLDQLNDEQTATVLSSSRLGWKTVEMKYVTIMKSSLEALANHFPTLVELNVDGYSGFSGESVVQVLSSCPNLRSLVTICNGDFLSQTKFLAVDAKVFIDQDPSTGSLKTWPCETSLRVLKVKIGNIPRPDLGLRNTMEEAYPGQGREIQTLVYERLGRLTGLQTLWLGHEVWHGRWFLHERQSPQMNCLEMSLESGLGRLSGLHEMKELGVSDMRMNMGIGVIRWMMKHWPNLEYVYGIDMEDGVEETMSRIGDPLEDSQRSIES
ncbi:hypothetical protein B0O80DRAFT_497542 [Mortierella sp. GBAus27b]|nr:hypothetical protein BGX31_006198 [Mortierella sp. GBA43]KAI8356015.1 hypothetical protein B0O80DRAFT_497542 [Mortierella sp. GBAus27b]